MNGSLCCLVSAAGCTTVESVRTCTQRLGVVGRHDLIVSCYDHATINFELSFFGVAYYKAQKVRHWPAPWTAAAPPAETARWAQ